LYVPDLRGNLLSVSAITNKGFQIEFNTDSANILSKKGSAVLKVLKRDKMYVIKIAQPNKAKIASSQKINMWHKRFGHLNHKNLKLLSDRGAVIGMDLPERFDSKPCKECNNVKVHCHFHSQVRARNMY